jgi:Chitobiase/beta-hexosaminidase C-terminal domain/Immunoglobulin domain
MYVIHSILVRGLFLAIATLALSLTTTWGNAGSRGRVARASDEPPTLVTQPPSTAGLEGDTVILSVAAAGTPPLQYQWFKDGELIPWAITSVFEIPFLLEADAGTYRVEVSNAFGKVVSANAIVSFVPLIQIYVNGAIASGLARVSEPVTVSLQAARTGWTLHYTTDGSEPLPSSPIYTAPFVVSQNLELRVAADSPDHQEFLEGDSLRFLFLSPQVVTWGEIPKLRYPESGGVSATASSGLPVRIRVISGPGVLEGSVLRATGAGTVVLRAEQEGNETYAASSSEQTLEIGRGIQTVTFQPIPDRFVEDPPVQLVASTSTGLPVTFQLISGPALLVGNLLTPNGAGRIEVKALQEGTDLWLPAEAIQSFVAKQTAAPAVLEIVGPNKDGSLLLGIRAPLGQQGTIQFSADLKAWNSVGEATGAGFQQPVSILIPPGSTEGAPVGFWRFVDGKPAP